MNKRLLHIIATPRGGESRTLKISNAFLAEFKWKNPECIIDEINLPEENLPSLTVKRVDGKYALLSGNELSGESKKAWQDIIKHIDRFLSADAYLISTPMWNFGIPYMLKHYIDVIVQPKYLFRYTEKGVEGLVKGKRMIVISSRGGDYSIEPMIKLDLQEPYLRAIFGLAGIIDITFVKAQPMDMDPKMRDERIKEAQGTAKRIAGSF
ncbi:MAG: NAD(P)H-dependent oxidoreductase [Candidatus Omnitrophica bacterium]|nr:NAD(P)H-dependent oxidoreductase [Candidatus Omnitrophota bacterium]